MQLNGIKIVIVGAGIGGLAAALALKARGADVSVLEQAEAITEVGAGIQVSPNGAAVLTALGLQKEFEAASIRCRAVVLADYNRRGEVLRLDLMRHAHDLRFAFVHRADMIDLLADAVRQAGINIRLLQKVDSVEPGSPPTLRMTSGARISADLIVGADGLHSPARKALNGSSNPFFTGQVAWRATVPNDIGLADEARVFMAPGRHLVCYPLRNGSLVNLVAVQERRDWAAESWSHSDDADNLRAAFSDFSDLPMSLLGRVVDPGLWGLFRHPVASCWHKGRVTILGDAAHPTLPFMAQGANMALEDAWVLAEELARAPGIEIALEAYQNRRRPRVERVVAAANGNAWKYHLRSGPVRAAAHVALRLGGMAAPVRMVRQFDWIYRHDVTCGD
ncbi:FAD-dependent monooxygenase [Ruegeria sp. WL0004]|uniref:FAD-dependent monooxygenase n=1 Tax=Ruegeria marisflavi TaxID=2984152 RepID=A0ABT2WS27_9RHOB|nr:FAD-dependent monooxygenase [Ruegeria sp. WL0004]MCU9836908.1 FAD-dependent monooxygenase [Ruegeria sp. WL0004]